MSVPANLAFADGGYVAPTDEPKPAEFSLSGESFAEESEEKEKKERAVVENFWKQYRAARGFDLAARRAMAMDRRYASGRAMKSWAVSTNVIGSMIDILKSALYARDPDVSITKSPQVEESNTRDMELFAQTLQIVVSRLWKDAKMKKRMRRVIRSILSVGQGWLKVTMVGQKKPDPIVQSNINSLEENLKRIHQLQANVLSETDDDGSPMSSDELAVAEASLQQQIEQMSKKLEVMVYEGLAVDFVKAEDMQVGTDVDVVEEYLDSDIMYHAIYVPKADARSKFPRMSATDVQTATEYFRTATSSAVSADSNGAVIEMPLGAGGNNGTGEDGESYTTTPGTNKSVPYVRVIEAWDRRDGSVYTSIDGVPFWVVEPYKPPYASRRFFPFFYFSVYEVDDERHPQSLAGREAKLQDEYACTRSNFRISRERSTPGTLFNASALSDEEVRKVQGGIREEMVPIRPTKQDQPISEIFAEKPISRIDPRLYDTTPILQDMERVAGVQEAQTAAVTVAKTATEADIQQSGFSARTDAARDDIEIVLTELAQYTAECAVQCLTAAVVQRMAGKAAFWPEGMDLQDLFTLVEVQIEAGTTGKPKKKTDQAAWGTVLPMIQALQAEIAQLYTAAAGNPMLLMAAQPLIDAKKELLKQTMLIAGVETDLERFLPQPPQPLAPPAGPMLPPGAIPGDPAAGGDLPAPPGAPGGVELLESAPPAGPVI